MFSDCLFSYSCNSLERQCINYAGCDATEIIIEDSDGQLTMVPLCQLKFINTHHDKKHSANFLPSISQWTPIWFDVELQICLHYFLPLSPLLQSPAFSTEHLIPLNLCLTINLISGNLPHPSQSASNYPDQDNRLYVQVILGNGGGCRCGVVTVARIKRIDSSIQRCRKWTTQWHQAAAREGRSSHRKSNGAKP